MIELIYTSARNGLKPGSSGFTSVAWTRGIPPYLIEPLESLSSYKHIFMPSDPLSSKNPVCFSYQTVQYGKVVFPVISRIAAAGLDYTSRSNKIAHHIIPQSAELAVSPAEICLEQSNFVSVWNKPPELLSERRLQYSDSAMQSTYAQTWEKWKGDAGWAGVIANKVMAILQGQKKRYSGECIYLEYDMSIPSLDLVHMIAEVTRLLPAGIRPECTFSTYFVQQKIGVNCLLRCALSDCLTLCTMKSMKPDSVIRIHVKEPVPAAFDNNPLVLTARSRQNDKNPDSKQNPLLLTDHELQLDDNTLILDNEAEHSLSIGTAGAQPTAILRAPDPLNPESSDKSSSQQKQGRTMVLTLAKHGDGVPGSSVSSSKHDYEAESSNRKMKFVRLCFMLLSVVVILGVAYAVYQSRLKKSETSEPIPKNPFAEFSEPQTSSAVPQLPKVRTQKDDTPMKENKPASSKKKLPDSEMSPKPAGGDTPITVKNVAPQMQSEIFLLIMQKLAEGKTEGVIPLPGPEKITAISTGNVQMAQQYETETFSISVKDGTACFQIKRDAAYDAQSLADMEKTKMIVFHTAQGLYVCPLKINSELLAKLQPEIEVDNRYMIRLKKAELMETRKNLSDFLIESKSGISLMNLQEAVTSWNQVIETGEEIRQDIEKYETKLNSILDSVFASPIKWTSERTFFPERLSEVQDQWNKISENERHNIAKQKELSRNFATLLDRTLPVFAVQVSKEELEDVLETCDRMWDEFSAVRQDNATWKRWQKLCSQYQTANKKGYEIWKKLSKCLKRQNELDQKLTEAGKVLEMESNTLEKEVKNLKVWDIYAPYCERKKKIPLDGADGVKIREKLAQRLSPQYQYKAK